MASEFPISADRFVQKLKGTSDEVWSKYLAKTAGRMKYTEDEWRVLLDKLKSE